MLQNESILSISHYADVNTVIYSRSVFSSFLRSFVGFFHRYLYAAVDQRNVICAVFSIYDSIFT